jgi:phage baseplate assembly protein V
MHHNLRNLINIGIARLFYPNKPLQQVQVDIRDGETRDGLEHAQPYGFAHFPHPGAETVNVFPGGDKGFGIVIAVHDRRYRMQLTATGDVAIYDHRGQSVHLSDAGVIVKSDKLVKVEAPKTEASGDITLTGTVNLNGDVFINGIKQVGG